MNTFGTTAQKRQLKSLSQNKNEPSNLFDAESEALSLNAYHSRPPKMVVVGTDGDVGTLDGDQMQKPPSFPRPHHLCTTQTIDADQRKRTTLLRLAQSQRARGTVVFASEFHRSLVRREANKRLLQSPLSPSANDRQTTIKFREPTVVDLVVSPSDRTCSTTSSSSLLTPSTEDDDDFSSSPLSFDFDDQSPPPLRVIDTIGMTDLENNVLVAERQSAPKSDGVLDNHSSADIDALRMTTADDDALTNDTRSSTTIDEENLSRQSGNGVEQTDNLVVTDAEGNLVITTSSALQSDQLSPTAVNVTDDLPASENQEESKEKEEEEEEEEGDEVGAFEEAEAVEEEEQPNAEPQSDAVEDTVSELTAPTSEEGEAQDQTPTEAEGEAEREELVEDAEAHTTEQEDDESEQKELLKKELSVVKEEDSQEKHATEDLQSEAASDQDDETDHIVAVEKHLDKAGEQKLLEEAEDTPEEDTDVTATENDEEPSEIQSAEQQLPDETAQEEQGEVEDADTEQEASMTEPSADDVQAPVGMTSSDLGDSMIASMRVETATEDAGETDAERVENEIDQTEEELVYESEDGEPQDLGHDGETGVVANADDEVEEEKEEIALTDSVADEGGEVVDDGNEDVVEIEQREALTDSAADEGGEVVDDGNKDVIEIEQPHEHEIEGDVVGEQVEPSEEIESEEEEVHVEVKKEHDAREESEHELHRHHHLESEVIPQEQYEKGDEAAADEEETGMISDQQEPSAPAVDSTESGATSVEPSDDSSMRIEGGRHGKTERQATEDQVEDINESADQKEAGEDEVEGANDSQSAAAPTTQQPLLDLSALGTADTGLPDEFVLVDGDAVLLSGQQGRKMEETQKTVEQPSPEPVVTSPVLSPPPPPIKAKVPSAVPKQAPAAKKPPTGVAVGARPSRTGPSPSRTQSMRLPAKQAKPPAQTATTKSRGGGVTAGRGSSFNQPSSKSPAGRQRTPKRTPSDAAKPESGAGAPKPKVDIRSIFNSDRDKRENVRQKRMEEERKQREEQERKRQDEEERKKEADAAFQSWLQRKKSDKRSHSGPRNQSISPDEEEQERRVAAAQSAFQCWLARKRAQRCDSQRLLEAHLKQQQALVDENGRQRSEDAFEAWTEVKRRQQRREMIIERARQHELMSVTPLRNRSLQSSSSCFASLHHAVAADSRLSLPPPPPNHHSVVRYHHSSTGSLPKLTSQNVHRTLNLRPVSRPHVGTTKKGRRMMVRSFSPRSTNRSNPLHPPRAIL